MFQMSVLACLKFALAITIFVSSSAFAGAREDHDKALTALKASKVDAKFAHGSLFGHFLNLEKVMKFRFHIVQTPQFMAELNKAYVEYRQFPFSLDSKNLARNGGYRNTNTAPYLVVAKFKDILFLAQKDNVSWIDPVELSADEKEISFSRDAKGQSR